MSAGACTCLCWALLLVGFFVSAEQEVVTAESRQNVILPCRAPDNNPIRAVVWAKPALENEHVYLYRDGWFDPDEQNPAYRNRVDLQDRQMKDGDVSLILKDVTTDDEGTYECRVIQRGVRRSSKVTFISTIYLRVAPPPGPTGGLRDGSVGLVITVSICALLLVAFVATGLYIYICR